MSEGILPRGSPLCFLGYREASALQINQEFPLQTGITHRIRLTALSRFKQIQERHTNWQVPREQDLAVA